MVKYITSKLQRRKLYSIKPMGYSSILEASSQKLSFTKNKCTMQGLKFFFHKHDNSKRLLKMINQQTNWEIMFACIRIQ